MQIFRLFLIIAVALSTFQGCEETPTQPQIGPGNVLKATIDGVAYEFSISDATYDSGIIFGEFTGSTDEEPVQSVRIGFSYDIDARPLPVTLPTPEGRIIVVLNDSLGVQTSYLLISPNPGSVTLTASNGEIVDGTFSGTLENSQDENDRIAVTNGEFSVKLTRN